MKNEINRLISVCWDKVVEYRRYLHMHPELSRQENNTAKYVAERLREMGLEPAENVGGNGVTALIRGHGDGKCVALRADMDALEITEKTCSPFASVNPGVMHACGHDTHTAMLLGAAWVLCQLRDRFCGSVKLLFQPSEENAADSGAKSMIRDGCMENPHVDAVFAQHIWPGMPYGKISVKTGGMMAASDRLFITVNGRSSHGSNPQDGVDAIVIASQIVTALQSVVSRNCAALDSAVVTIGKINGGTRYNVIPGQVTMEGTCRSLTPQVQKLMAERITSIATGIAQSMGGSCDVKYVFGLSPVVNSVEMFECMRRSVVDYMGEEFLHVPERGALTGEDFSAYGAQVPYGFAWLGCGDTSPLHSDTFLPDEEVMRSGVAYLAASALQYLEN